MRAYASMYRPFRPTAISGHTRLTSGHKKTETYHAIHYTPIGIPVGSCVVGIYERSHGSWIRYMSAHLAIAGNTGQSGPTGPRAAS